MKKLLLVFALASPLCLSAQTITYMEGFETGDARINTIGALGSVQSSTVISGGFSLKNAVAGTTLAIPAQATLGLRLNFISPSPASTTNFIQISVSGTLQFTIGITASNFLQATDNGTTIGLTQATGTHAVNANQPHELDIAYDDAAGGILKLWLDRTLDIDTTHATLGSAPNQLKLYGKASPNENFFDDIVDVSTAVEPAVGQIIIRSPKAGTPTYDTWAKSNASTIDTVWANTPFTTDTYASSSTSGAAQTALVGSFSTTQSPHGTSIINSYDTINACQALGVVKTGVSGSQSFRYRINGANTDATATWNYASDTWVTSTIFVPGSLALLNGSEVGVAKGANTALVTAEDVWMQCDKTDGTPPAGVPTSGDGAFQ